MEAAEGPALEGATVAQKRNGVIVHTAGGNSATAVQRANGGRSIDEGFPVRVLTAASSNSELGVQIECQRGGTACRCARERVGRVHSHNFNTREHVNHLSVSPLCCEDNIGALIVEAAHAD